MNQLIRAISSWHKYQTSLVTLYVLHWIAGNAWNSIALLWNQFWVRISYCYQKCRSKKLMWIAQIIWFWINLMRNCSVRTDFSIYTYIMRHYWISSETLKFKFFSQQKNEKQKTIISHLLASLLSRRHNWVCVYVFTLCDLPSILTVSFLFVKLCPGSAIPVGIDVQVESIDSISEVNMVSVYSFINYF